MTKYDNNKTFLKTCGAFYMNGLGWYFGGNFPGDVENATFLGKNANKAVDNLRRVDGYDKNLPEI